MELIESVIPWVNPMDKKWQANYKKYAGSHGDKDPNRFRDAGTFPYWFQLIRKNCKFDYRIILLLAQESQVPTWLDTNASDLRIVFHDEFIPNAELPTFNSSVINCYIPFIPGLSEKYILFNDDMFMIRPSHKDDWFSGDRPRFCSEWREFPIGGKTWEQNIALCQDLVNQFTLSKVFYNPEHAPLPHVRSLDLFFWHKYGKVFKEALKGSRFRKSKNITDWIFSMLYKVGEFGEDRGNISTYYCNEDISVPDSVIACYNDTERVSNYKKYGYVHPKCCSGRKMPNFA